MHISHSIVILNYTKSLLQETPLDILPAALDQVNWSLYYSVLNYEQGVHMYVSPHNTYLQSIEHIQDEHGTYRFFQFLHRTLLELANAEERCRVC